MQSYKYTKANRIRRKHDIVYVMGGKCAVCGYNKCESALEVHHLNPKTKTLMVSQALGRNWKKTRSELKKCILLCANCHREIHAGVSKMPTKSTFSETRAQEIDEKLQKIKEKRLYHCKCCGATITREAERCKKCSAEHKHRFERPPREEFKALVRTYPLLRVASMFGVTENAIKKACLSYGLPSKKKVIDAMTDEEWNNA